MRASPAVTRALLWIAAALPALYASRVGAEAVPSQYALIGLAVGAALGIAVSWGIRRGRGVHLNAPAINCLWPPLLLLPAIVYPLQSPPLLLICGLLFLVALVVPSWRYNGPLLDAGVFIVALLVYMSTLAQGVQPADAGEFQLVLAEWGVAHPPGYPLYTVLGGLFARIIPPVAVGVDFADFANRVNLFSALAGALTLAVVSRAVRKETGLGWAGLIAAGVLGAAATLWTTSTQASIRPMTALFAALLVDAALSYRRATANDAAPRQNKIRWRLVYFGAAAGLGVTHHASLVFPGAALALAMFAAWPGIVRQPRLWIAGLLAALAGMLPWLYLLLRGAAGDAVLAPAGLATWDGLWTHVLARGFAGDMFYYRALPDVLERLGLIGQVLAFQWHGLILLLGLFALTVLTWRDRWLLAALGGAFAVHTLVAATYRAPQTVEYMIPAYVCFAVAVGWALGKDLTPSVPLSTLVERGKPRGLYAVWRVEGVRCFIHALLVSAALVGILWSAGPTWNSLKAYQQRDPTAANARALLQAAPEQAHILANWHHATPLWALQAEGLRPDVTVEYVYPRGAEPILDTWVRLIGEDGGARPLITCAYYPEQFRFIGRTFSALESCWRAGPGETSPDSARTAAFGEFTLFVPAEPAHLRIGERNPVPLTWQVPGPLAYGEYTTFIHLVDSEGRVLAQDDLPLAAPDLAEPGLVTQGYVLHLPHTLPADRSFDLLAGIYRSTPAGPEVLPAEDGALRSPVAALRVEAARLPPVTAHELHIPFEDDLLLLGYDYDLSVPGRARLFLHWQITSQRAGGRVQLRLRNGGGVVGGDPAQNSAGGEIRFTGSPGYLSVAYILPVTQTLDGLWLRLAEGESGLWPGRAAWNLPLLPEVYIPGPQQHDMYIPLGDVVITDYTVEPAMQPGDFATVSYTLRSATAITQDISVKLALGTVAQVDVTPVGGAIPTLKWGWGASITDTLRVQWPDDHPEPPGPLTLTFYDAFSGRVWPVFDPAYVERGPGLPLE